jgi:hypothetical protein
MHVTYLQNRLVFYILRRLRVGGLINSK